MSLSVDADAWLAPTALIRAAHGGQTDQQR